MGSEAGLWKTLLRRFSAIQYAHTVRIECVTAQGVPDVSWAVWGSEGWIELKHREDWPARENTPVRFSHLTEDQVLWLADRGLAGGNAKYLIQVARDYFLFNWDVGPQIYGGLPRKRFEAAALFHWKNRLPSPGAVVRALSVKP